MVKFEHIINSERGVHARPAGRLAQEANKFPDSRIVLKNVINNEAIASSPLKVMQLELKKDDKVVVSVNGGNENEVAEKIKDLLQKHF
ncbi:MAG: HPr family phosphocarrier protein [Candidatus Improbicoccus pseudotrichonymphae]|uniref:HPr family phosphocarrier protein n=1 Tax=Candidatus Improbicoccus pseudotrichonymphae TaxID=3033792 RepID=A0AA48KVQ3_9FIRM|nr:MAG: HPr family phosphocarrier protein [Candidatus Improbicoccus pseudotrichonymphae]